MTQKIILQGEANPSQGGQYYRFPPLEEGVAQAHGHTICMAPLYAAAGSGTGLWPHFMQCRSLDWDFPTVVSRERQHIKWRQDVPLPGSHIFQCLHIPVPWACATPFSLKAHPLCLQYAELGEPVFFKQSPLGWYRVRLTHMIWQLNIGTNFTPNQVVVSDNRQINTVKQTGW